MTTAPRPMREMYEHYLDGKVTFEDLKLATDAAADEYQRARGRTLSQPPETATKRTEAD